LTFDVPAVSSVGINAEIGVVMVGQNSAETNSITITPSGSDKFIINGQVVSGSIQLLQIGDSRTLIPCTISSGAMAGTYWLVA
jgi:short subunit fatty acids transporter